MYLESLRYDIYFQNIFYKIDITKYVLIFHDKATFLFFHHIHHIRVLYAITESKKQQVP